jgi:shikimate dehydrogenase
VAGGAQHVGGVTTLKLTGATRLYAIVGDPIAQVRSPEVFTDRFAQSGLDAVLIPAHVPVARFDDVIPALMALGNLDGILVTVPFKARMVRFADALGETARHLGAVNALRREPDGSWTGDMFDGVGFLKGVERKASVHGRQVVLFGAGGAGSAIAYALAAGGVRSLDIVDPDRDRADALVRRLQGQFPACAVATAAGNRAEADMVVNASTVGMKPDQGMPGDIGPLSTNTLVADVVISERPTALIDHAIRCGCTWVDGRDMHAGQVDALVAFFASASRASVNAAPAST